MGSNKSWWCDLSYWHCDVYHSLFILTCRILWLHDLYWGRHEQILCGALHLLSAHLQFTKSTQIANFMGPRWGPPRSCRPEMGPVLAPWTCYQGSNSCMSRCGSVMIWIPLHMAIPLGSQLLPCCGGHLALWASDWGTPALHMYLSQTDYYPPAASFTKEVNPRLAKRPLIFNGRLAHRGLTSFVKEATCICPWH